MSKTITSATYQMLKNTTRAYNVLVYCNRSLAGCIRKLILNEEDATFLLAEEAIDVYRGKCVEPVCLTYLCHYIVYCTFGLAVLLQDAVVDILHTCII